MKKYIVRVEYRDFVFADAIEAMMFANQCFEHYERDSKDKDPDVEITIVWVEEDAQED